MGDSNANNGNEQGLFKAVEAGDISSVQALLIGVDLVCHDAINLNAMSSSDGDTPLMKACQKGNLGICQLLLESGADVNGKNRYGKTPLHRACFDCNFELAKLLIEHGAGVNLQDDVLENTPLLWTLCFNEDLAMVQLLLEHGADVHVKNKYGMTPLYIIANRKGNDALDIVKALIENGGADVNLAGNRGLTPLHRACSDGQLGMVKLLIANGANLHSCDENGWTAFHWACTNGDHLEVAQLLLSRGASVKMKTTTGSTPLHVASERNHLEVVWFLVRQHPWLVSERFEAE